MKNKIYFVYILASKRNGTLYVGITSDLIKRVWQHRTGIVQAFTRQYKVYMLVYYEQYTNPNEAIVREKYIKGKKRNYKLALIEGTNAEWKDLYEQIK